MKWTVFPFPLKAERTTSGNRHRPPCRVRRVSDDFYAPERTRDITIGIRLHLKTVYVRHGPAAVEPERIPRSTRFRLDPHVSKE